MAKKNGVVKKTKTTKLAAASGEKPVVKNRQTKPAATRKPPAVPKPPAKPRTRKTASNQPRNEDKNFVVYGTVTYADGSPAEGATVIAYDHDDSGKDILGQPVVTTATGSFSISYREADFRKSKKEIGGADVIVCVYNAKQELLFTSKKKNNAPAKYELNITLPAEQFVVRGKVTDANQKPLANMTVRAYERDLRQEEFLGKTATDAWGNFRFVIASDKFRKADSMKPLRPELIVRVFDEGETKLAESPRVRPEDHEVVIDLIAPVSRLSEWEILAQEIIPLLVGQGKDGQLLPPWEINDDDIAFLVDETGLEREQVRMWAAAAKMAHEVVLFGTAPNMAMELASVGHSATSGQQSDALEFIVFYGWLRDEQPQDFAALLRLGSTRLIASLGHAIAQHYIPDISRLKERMQKVIDARQISEALKPVPEGEPASLGGALRTMPLAAQLQLDDVHGLGAQIVSVMLEEPVQGNSQWRQIRDLVTDDNLFNSVQRTIGLMQLTGGHIPLMQALQLNDVNETAASLADLVKHDRQQWIELAEEHGTPKEFEAETEELRAMKFGQQIAHRVELMHPAPFINHRLLTGQIPIAEEIQKPLTDFLTVNPSMRIKDGSVLVWLDSDTVQTGSMSADQIERLTPELLKLERVARITPSLEYVGPMLKLGYESGRDIVQRHSREVFVNEMRDLIGSETEAGQIHDAAAGAVATAEALVLTYSPRFSGIDLPVMPSNVGAPAQAPQGTMAVRSLTRPLMLSANLQRLFGSQDYCECAHGASLYGPAAYLADLLHMLGLGRANAAGLTALQVLLDRRPDLAEIDLTGDNAEITLPYIDLVLEILETPEILALPRFRQTGVSPVNGFDGSLSSGTVPDEMKNKLAELGIQLGDEYDARGSSAGPWSVRDKSSGVKYRLTQSMAARYYDMAIYPQSVASAVKGYRPFSGQTSMVVRNVGTATFPWKLPFDTARDEANTWLEQLGATKAEVMQAMSTDRWGDVDTACEYLNISPAERRILNTAPTEEHKDWGFAASTDQTVLDPIAGKNRGPGVWHELLKNVSLLRSRARLTHRELLNVLETRFVRAGGGRLEITGKECDTAEMLLGSMNAALARRIHIFVRLWRKLGWTTVELDRAILAYGTGSAVSGFEVFTDLFLRFVANIARLHASSKLPILQLLDLFGQPSATSFLDTTEYWDHTGKLPQRTLSRYQQWFDNPTIGKPLVPEFRLHANRIELVTIGRPDKIEMGLPKPRISDHLIYIAAALAVSESELAELLSASSICLIPQKIEGRREGRPIEVQGLPLKNIEIVLGENSPNSVFSFAVQESDSESDISFANVSAADLSGGTSRFRIDSATQKLTILNYTGSRKYLRCVVEPESGANPSLWIRVRIETKPGIVSDDLTIANLTTLCRYALLRRLIGVPINELRTLMSLTGVASLTDVNSPEKVLGLLDARQSLKTLGLTVSQAEQLLLGPSGENGVELNTRAVTLLTSIRAEYQAIRDETTVADNKRSDLLKNVLTGLGWDDRLIADVLGAEGLGSNLGDYEAPLDLMPIGVTLPASLTYHDASKLLMVRLVRPQTIREDIAPLLADSQISFDVREALRLISGGRNETPLDLLPAGVTLPASLTYDNARKLLIVRLVHPQTMQADIAPLLTNSQINSNVHDALRRISGGDNEAPLDLMPSGITLPTSFTYHDATKRLVASRITHPQIIRDDIATLLTNNAVRGDLRVALKSISAEAVRRLKLLDTTKKWMRVNKLPVHRERVGAVPDLISGIPAEWKGRFYYDSATAEVCFVGWMKEVDKVALKLLEVASPSASTPSFASAIDDLFDASEIYSASSSESALVVSSDGLTIEKLLLETDGLEARCGLVLEKLLPEWRKKKLHAKLSSTLSQGLELTPETAEALLGLLCLAVPPVTPATTRPSFETLVTDARLLASDPATKPSRAAFEQALDAAARLLILGKLVVQQKMDAVQVPWLGGAWTDLNLTGLPTQPAAVSPNWSALSALASLITLRDKAAVGVSGLQKILVASPLSPASIAFAPLAVALGCSADTLRVFAGADEFNISAPTWFRVPSQLLRLVNCLELILKLNMPAGLFVKLKPSRAPADAEAEVQTLRQMALGQSTGSTWTDDERKVLDGIRQRRRDATVDYLVQKHGVLDANDLYGRYLIDPQMNPCMMTSRIKQGISSVQLFIQRCLMNLEPDASPDMIEVRSWEKYYRMWEANRKVLLYPENWIEPELRDDKTPFFDDVMSSLQQGDATSDKAQLAVQGFLEKLTDLSRMDVVATCSSYDDNGYLLVTYVFARTTAEPHAYWCRKFIKQDVKNPTSSMGVWTAWQPVDLDIEGDHLFPFVWQGRLFLFWAIFSEEAQEPTNVELKANGKPNKVWGLKLAWSEFKSGKWSSRKVSLHKVIDFPLYIRRAEQKDFYFQAFTNEPGVTIRVYFKKNRNIDPLLPRSLELASIQNIPISTLYFDGKNVRMATWFLLNRETQTGEWRLNHSSETPIDQTRSITISNHSNMKNVVPSGTLVSFSLPSSNGIVITPQAVMPRATQLLFPPEKGDIVFSAPRFADWNSFSTIPRDIRSTPFIQDDWKHQFFVYPTWRLQYVDVGGGVSGVYGSLPNLQLREIPKLHFYALSWPHIDRLRETLSSKGIDKLLSYDSQEEKQGGGVLGYFREYLPSSDVVSGHPDGDFEFKPQFATAQYNWELFFHAPFSIACNLSKNQRFEEARRWFHYIFDPTDNTTGASSDRYWRFRPFREAGQGMRIDELARRLADPSDHSLEKAEFQTLIAMWKDQPFQPHLVARLRKRSYMYTVVMKYLDNLIAWGDQLFRRETLEALNEATQLYILAAQILGRRPEGIPRRTRPVVKSFSELFSSQRDDLDDLSNALVEAENLVPTTSTAGSTQASGNLKFLYFCVPNNPKLLEYYDRVEDRLFKLRNCMNIDGVVRHLPLFEPAIDPSMLVRAAAAGVDVSAVLADLNAPLPFYRFNVMAQKATELCSEVKSLGAALLSAIEKGDAETMALMRSTHELQMLQSVRMVKELQLYEAKANIDAIGVSLESAQKRFTHYVGLVSQIESISNEQVVPIIQSLVSSAVEPLNKVLEFVQSNSEKLNPITKSSGDLITAAMTRTAEALSATLLPEGTITDKVPMNAAEKRQLSELKSAHDLQQKAMDQRLVAQVLAKIPDFTVGASGIASPVATFQIGGTLFSQFANFSASILDTEASEHTYRAGLHSTLAGYQRRAADWLLQAELAAKEIEQITKQIAASNLRIAIASQELRNHDLQAENARAVDEFMHSKYSNRELYSWMSGQLSNLHFQAYQLAYDVAKRAERCFKHELGVNSVYIKFGYWDNLKKGLLAGENLLSDVKRMEVAYLNQNARELEITKHVSLRQLNPMALTRLRESGECEFEVPEALFDMDFPGHYFRRIKSVSISVPCVVGPYASVSGTLTLLSSKLREKSVVSGGYVGETNYSNSYLPIQSISTSTGQNDSGLFELNFRDERYLPFEGGGAISNWRFKLPEEFRAFDYNSISDVILHIRYTARNGGEPLANSAKAAVRSQLNALHQLPTTTETGLVQVLSLRHEYPTEWSQLQSGVDGTICITLDKARFPYFVSGETVSLVHFGALARVRTPDPIRDAQGVFCLKLTKVNGTSTASLSFPDRPNLGNWRENDPGGDVKNGPVTVSTISKNAQWELKLLSSAQSTAVIDKQHRALLEDIVLLVGYRIQALQV